MKELPSRRPTFLVHTLASACIAVSYQCARADSPPASPLAPADTLPLFQLPDDCRIELVAAEPDVTSPVHIAFDPAGRMWVVEYSDYPNGPAEGQPGASRIRVLTDDDGDGRYGNSQVFADQLLFANGLMFWRDGVLVTTDGALVFMRDTDGDGRADERIPWFTGFQRENPQLRANHPTLALDNHIYIANGLRGGDVLAVRPKWSEGAKAVSISGRDFRFDPLTGSSEAVSGMGQFGMSFDDWGRRFVCSNRNPCDHIVLEDELLRRNPLVAASRVVQEASVAGEASRIYPISRFWTTSNLHAGQFTAACGICLNRGSALPPSLAGASFVCDPTGNLVHCDILEPHGATFRARPLLEGREFLATTDGWFRPVNLTIGPDGALYVVDMYRAVIEHPQFMPDELKTRPDLLLGTDRGRIYRIVAADNSGPQEALTDLSKMWSTKLVNLLSHPNGWQRDTAHRLLLERLTETGDVSAVEYLKAQRESAPPAVGRVHALCLSDYFDETTNDWIRLALDDKHPRVAETAARLAAGRCADDPQLAAALVALLNRTDDARVAFQCVASLASVETRSPELVAALADRLHRDGADPWLRTAAAIACGTDGIAALEAVLRRPFESEPTGAAVVAEFSTLIGAGGNASECERAVTAVANSPRNIRWSCLTGLAAGNRRGGRAWTTVSAAFSADAQEHLNQWSAEAAGTALTSSGEDVQLAIGVLDLAPWLIARDPLLQLARSAADIRVQTAAVEALARRPETEVDAFLLDGFSGRTPAIRPALLAACLQHDRRVGLLLDEIEAGRISPREIDPTRATQLRNYRDQSLRARAVALLVDAAAADRSRVIADYEPCLSLPSDPLRGRDVFIKNCKQCHRIGELGVNVAPDISDSRVKLPAELLTSILDPNRAIDNNYFNYTLIDRDGVVHTGVVTAETATSVTLKQPEGKELTVPRDNIEELKSMGVSLMPVGLEQQIPQQEMADLISFIKNWRYLDGGAPPEVIR